MASNSSMVLVAFALVAAGLAGCSSESTPPLPDDDLGLRLVTIASGEQGAPAVSNPVLYSVHLLDTEKAYRDAWLDHNGTGAAPPVRFSDRTVLVVQLDGTPQNGWTVAVDNATWQGGAYRVHVVTSEPGINCVAQSHPSRVYTFVAFDRKPASAGDDRVLESRTHHVRNCL
jgi:hypothetical protein